MRKKRRKKRGGEFELKNNFFLISNICGMKFKNH